MVVDERYPDFLDITVYVHVTLRDVMVDRCKKDGVVIQKSDDFNSNMVTFTITINAANDGHMQTYSRSDSHLHNILLEERAYINNLKKWSNGSSS
jgi:hypothetical protein